MRIAVVGSGIAGLGASWILSQAHEVTLYESCTSFGGHTHTVDVEEDGRRIPVDTGFIVFNHRNYPHLSALFRHLQVPTRASDMSFAASLEGGRIEYAGDNLGKLFAQPSNLFRPGHWRMLADILRFNRLARAWLESGQGQEWTLGEFLARHALGREMSERYLLPMAAAIWSAPMARILDFPAESFLRFFHNHGLLQVADRPRWQTVVGGGREYVRRISAQLGESARAGTAVRSVRRSADGVILEDAAGGSVRYDQVVLACHADQALALMTDADPREREILSAFRFQPNRAFLHSDPALMPKRRRVWASWNYLSDHTTGAEHRLAVSYWMNRLQALEARRQYFVTLNPPQPPDPGLCWHQVDYEHPVFDLAAIRAQRRLPGIQGRHGLWFCGAWTANGFHEDGLRSALRVANAMGVLAPWQQGADLAAASTPGLRPVVEEA